MNIVIVNNYAEMSRKAAMIFLNQLALEPKSVFGLATGSTPLGLYEELIKNTREYSYDWSRVTAFNLDEYVGLGPDNEQSYNYFMRTHLFNHLNIKAKNILIPNGQANNLAKECSEYEKKIKDIPIDIQLVGIGENGHIGFNEPGSQVDSKTRTVKLSPSTIQANSRFFLEKSLVPKSALTMGINSILAAQKIVVLANGRRKSRAVKAMIECPVSSKCPASYLQRHFDVTVIIDKEAASLLLKEYTPRKAGWTDVRILNEQVVPHNKNILVISPHHDDSSVSAGAIMKVLSARNNLSTLVMTSGYRAVIRGKNKTERIKMRNLEARKESQILGSRLIIGNFKFYDQGKKYWRSDLAALAKIWRGATPQIIILPHRDDEHPTHRLATKLVLYFLEEKGIRDIELWFYEGLWSQHILNTITQVFTFGEKLLKIKKRAMSAHLSQTRRLPIIEAATALSQFRAKTIPEQLFVEHGRELPELSNYAEAFQVEEW